MKKLLPTGFLIYCAIAILTSCNHNPFHSHISEGMIEYKIVVLDSANPLAKMAPEKMVVKFKDNKACAELDAGLGMFQTVFINDEPNKKLTQLVRLMNKKYFFTADTGAVSKELAHDVHFDIVETNETKIIAGYTCKKAIAKSSDGKTPDAELYYTTDIQIEQPNWATPFKKIDGLLMQYRISKYGFYMEFTVDKVAPDKVDDGIFKIPADYKIMTQEQIDNLYKSFQ